MESELIGLEKTLVKLQSDLTAKTASHKSAMQNKQEMLQQTINSQEIRTSSRSNKDYGGSPKKTKEDIETQRMKQVNI